MRQWKPWVLFSVLGILGTLGYFFGADLWWSWQHERISAEVDAVTRGGPRFIGWRTVHKDTREREGHYILWREDTGVLWVEGWQFSDSERKYTQFDAEGHVLRQRNWKADEWQSADEPPWLWPVKHAPGPSAPWIAEGISGPEWWSKQDAAGPGGVTSSPKPVRFRVAPRVAPQIPPGGWSKAPTSSQ